MIRDFLVIGTALSVNQRMAFYSLQEEETKQFLISDMSLLLTFLWRKIMDELDVIKGEGVVILNYMWPFIVGTFVSVAVSMYFSIFKRDNKKAFIASIVASTFIITLLVICIVVYG